MEKERHASLSFRTTCFMYLTPACDRLTDRRKDQQNEDIEGVAALFRDVDCQGVAARYPLRSLARTLTYFTELPASVKGNCNHCDHYVSFCFFLLRIRDFVGQMCSGKLKTISVQQRKKIIKMA